MDAIEEPDCASALEPTPAADELSASERLILALENQRWKYAAAKENAILEQLGMSPTRYYQVLHALIDKPSALAAEPLLVNRLRRLRHRRAEQRSARR